ncbi:fibronectin type III domain-containing protein [Rhizobacter sp. P5_C2]
MLLAACGGDGSADGAVGDASLSAPLNLQAIPGDASATLSFTVTVPRTDLLFQVSCSADNSQVTVSMVSHATGTEQMQVTGLTNDLAYSCTVAITDASGASATSQPVQVTPTAAAPVSQVPAAPTDVRATAADASAIISFSAPVATVSSYTVTCQGTELNAYSTGTASPITVPGLGNGQRYACSVVATNSVGDSPASVQVEVIPAAPDAPPATRPDTPTILGAAPSDGALSVSFEPPAGMAPLATYRATCSATGVVVTAESSASPVFVPGLQNGMPYACSVTANTAAGASDASAGVTATPRTVPDAPRGISATPGSGAATVSFDAPSWNGGATITAYQVRCVAGLHEASVDTATAGTVVIAGLANDSTYSCSVTASNAAGSGQASTPAMQVTPVLSTGTPIPSVDPVPAAPSLASVTAGNALAIVNFAPNAPDASILSYTAACTTRDLPKASFSTTRAGSPITVSGLSNGRLYDCGVTARNASGDSLPSLSLDVTPRPAVPQAPELLYAEPANASAVLRFTPRSDNGSPIIRYDASCDLLPASGTASPITVDGLTNGTRYACTLTATNAVGSSESSNALPVRPLTIPDPVQGLAAQPGDGSVTLSFSAPASNGGGDISGYAARCSDSNGTSKSVLAESTGSRSIIVVGLSNGVSYSCALMATNGAGSSTASLVATPNASLPIAPTFTLSDPVIGDGALTFKFGKPAANLSDVSYAVACKQTATQTPVSPSGLNLAANPFSASLTGLLNGISYTCTATATNSKGSVSASASATPNKEPAAPTYAAGNTVIGDGALTFKFGKPAGNGADTAYSATCKNTSTNAGVTATVATGTDPFIVSLTGLANGSSYTCTAVATNSRSSASVNASATPYTAPTTPTVLSEGNGSSVGNQAVTVAFAASSSTGDTSSSLIYNASCTNIANAVDQKIVSGSASPIVVSPLTNGATYRCSVTAKNSHSAASSPSAELQLSPYTLPDAPGLTVSVIGPPALVTDATASDYSSAANAKLKLTVTAPASNGGRAISRYDLGCAAAGQASVTPVTLTAAGPATLAGLANNVSYSCWATAHNVGGDSAAAGGVALTAKTQPSVVTSVSAYVCSRNRIVLKFSAPAYNGAAAVTGYVAKLLVNNASGALVKTYGTTTPGQTTFTGLAYDTEYSMAVYASNAVGDGPTTTLTRKTSGESGFGSGWESCPE